MTSIHTGLAPEVYSHGQMNRPAATELANEIFTNYLFVWGVRLTFDDPPGYGLAVRLVTYEEVQVNNPRHWQDVVLPELLRRAENGEL